MILWWTLILLITVLVLDGVRMRGRLSALAVLPPAPTEAGAADVEPPVFVLAPGVTLADASRRDLAGYARATGAGLVDVIPRDLPTIRALSYAQLVDPRRYRKDRLAIGRSAGHALVISADVARRAGLAGPTVTPPHEVAFIALAARLRHYAVTAELAVAPEEHAAPAPLSRRLGVLLAVLGPSAWFALALQPVFWVLIGLGVWRTPGVGITALAVWHLQPLLAIAGTPVRSRDLLIATVLRAPIELGTLIATLAGRWRPPAPAEDPVEARRPEYTRLAATSATFWEPRRETCPVCASPDLRVHLEVPDMLQHKPGRFTLEKCRACAHIFQNPRLSIAGLDFYYKDFYDGLGEAGMEFIFGFGSGQYHDRAKMVRKATATDPPRWLDVGAGHGHFCAAARDDLPTTRFDGLDLSESIDEAHRRGWIDGKFRGLFPELAPSLAGTYDAVSMSHYLEHTLDPRAELAAAHTALVPGGHLLIEVPDPEFGLGKLLGRLWLPYFQPQHLHLLSTTNLERLLREHGFEPVAWDRGTAHQRVDLFFAVMLGLGRLAPPARLPWRPRTALGSLRRTVVWVLGAPIIVMAAVGDQLLAPLIRRSKASNTYRVLARRAASPHAGSPRHLDVG